MLVHWIWFSRLSQVTIGQKLSLLRQFRDPEDICKAEEEALSQVEGMTAGAIASLMNKDLTQAQRIITVCIEKNISILTYGDGAYPNKLKNIHNPPLVLYYKGFLPDWESVPAIAIVGTRKPTADGMQMAYKLGCQIAACGGLVVSGGADGIDTQALSGALEAGKRVVAVLGFGADVVYPSKNKALFDSICRQGCLLTEYAPGTPPNAWNFPQRNRIISGLCCGVTVVEAPQRSGALNTATHAADQGRDIFVVPGNPNNPACAGSNQLLLQRALPVFQGWDVMREYESLYPDTVTNVGIVMPEKLPSKAVSDQCEPPQPAKKVIDNREKSRYSVKDAKMPALSEEEKQVWQQLTREPKMVDEVILAAHLPAGKVLSILTMLAMKGVVTNHPGKRVSLK